MSAIKVILAKTLSFAALHLLRRDVNSDGCPLTDQRNADMTLCKEAWNFRPAKMKTITVKRNVNGMTMNSDQDNLPSPYFRTNNIS